VFDWVALVNSFFLKSKRHRFSKKTNKNQQVATGFLTESCRADPPDRVGFENYEKTYPLYLNYLFFFIKTVTKMLQDMLW